MADLFFDDSDEAEDDEEAIVAAKPLPGFYQDLLGNLSESKGDKTQDGSEGGTATGTDGEGSDKPLPEDEPVQKARYWWEEGYEEPAEGVQSKEKKRVYNRKTGAYEDVGAPASRSPSVSSKASSRAPSSNEGVLPGTKYEVEALDAVLSRIDFDIEKDDLPENYQARPVPKRAWNPDTGNFEVVSETAIVALSSSSGRGWIPRKEEASQASPLPIEDMLRKLDTEEQSPAKEPETRILALTNEAQSESKLPAYSTAEMPLFSRQKLGGKVLEGNVIDMMERYAIDEEVETPSLYGTEEPDYVQQVKRIEQVRRRKREKAIEEAIEADPELEEYLRPKAEANREEQQADVPGQRPHLGKWTQSGPAEQRTTLAQDQGEGQVKLRPTKREPLPGMGRSKRASGASSSSSKPMREVPLGTTSGSSAWSGFSLLPGMPLPFEEASSSASSRFGVAPKAVAGSGIAAPDKAASSSSSRQNASSQTLAEKLRNHRQRIQEDDDETELQEAFQSIGGSRLSAKESSCQVSSKATGESSTKGICG